jgi:GNAT superfamily N-acetyltransferase
MPLRSIPLTGEEVDRLPDPCRRCLYWELGTACPEPLWPAAAVDPTSVGPGGAPPTGGERPVAVRTAPLSAPLTRKQAWVSARVQEGTPPGRVVLVDGTVAGYALYAPSKVFARRGPLLPAAGRDALLLATIAVRPSHRGHGYGHALLLAALREAHRLELAAVEAYGDRRWRDQSCLLPVTWLLHEGFVVAREHPRTPLLRLELRRIARWAGSLEHAWEEVLGHLPRRVPVTDPLAPGVVGVSGPDGDGLSGRVR